MRRNAISLKILERYAAGERIFKNLEREDGIYNFENASLSNADFSGNFIFATFRNANLEGANFSNCNVKTCDFSHANLRGSTFQDSAIDAAIFDGADLTDANFEGASEQGYDYKIGELPFRSNT